MVERHREAGARRAARNDRFSITTFFGESTRIRDCCSRQESERPTTGCAHGRFLRIVVSLGEYARIDAEPFGPLPQRHDGFRCHWHAVAPALFDKARGLLAGQTHRPLWIDGRIAPAVVPENLVRRDSRNAAESAHHST
jgi:hypothetical protein